jgi:hypothetical protein
MGIEREPKGLRRRVISRGAGASTTEHSPHAPSSAGGLTEVRLGLVPMAIACAACLLFLPSSAFLAAGLLLARFRLERVLIESERDVAIARIKGDAAIARLAPPSNARRNLKKKVAGESRDLTKADLLRGRRPPKPRWS